MIPCTRRTRNVVRALILATELTALSACAAPAHNPFTAAPPSEAAHIEVTNTHFSDMRIYVLRGSARLPLGPVRSGETRTFKVGKAELGPIGDIRLVADPLGSTQEYVTEIIPLHPGQRLEWRLAHALHYSSIRVIG